MAYENFRVETGADGIARRHLGQPGRSMNVFTAKVMDELAAIIESVASDAAIKGAVIVVGQEGFFRRRRHHDDPRALLRVRRTHEAGPESGAARAARGIVAHVAALPAA